MREKVFECAAGYVVRAVTDDAPNLAARLRESDIVECCASHGAITAESIADCIDMTPEPRSVFNNSDRLIAVYGCTPLPNRAGGSPWLLATVEFEGVALAFLRHCRGVINVMLHDYGYLENYIHESNATSREWLRWCGFRFDDPAPYGVRGEMFRRFWLCATR